MKYKFVAFLIAALFIFGLLMNIYINTDYTFSNIKDKIIRLHVVANSDSPEDQALKLSIRDAVINEMAPILKDLTETEKVKAIIVDNLESIKKAAQIEMKKLNKNFPISVELGEYEFPTKVYGNFTFPAGKYQALNIRIGEGKGKNWWCVMFPPLCFIDIAQGAVSDDILKEFKEVLTEKEMELLKAHQEDEIPVKMKFKIVELAKSFNTKIAKILGKKLEM